jgi:hypothetical protein
VAVSGELVQMGLTAFWFLLVAELTSSGAVRSLLIHGYQKGLKKK